MNRVIIVSIGLIACLEMAAAAEDDTKVRLDIYMRVGSEECWAFMRDTVPQVMEKPGLSSITSVRILPVANMKLNDQSKFACEGGDSECEAHRWIACLVNDFDYESQREGIKCMFSTRLLVSWRSTVAACYSDEQKEKLNTCVASKSTELLQKSIALLKGTDLRWIPYVLVNGDVIPVQQADTDTIVRKICSAYSGISKPEGCTSMTDRSKKAAIAEENRVVLGKEANANVGEKTNENDDTKGDKEGVAKGNPHGDNTIGVKADLIVDEREKPPRKVEQDTFERVALEVSVRAYCPDCEEFITNALFKLWNMPGFSKILDIYLNPAFGMQETNGIWDCIGGPEECTANRWFSCVIEEFRTHEEYIKHIKCLASHKRPIVERLPKCFSEAQIDKLGTCVETKSDALLRNYIDYNNAEDPQSHPLAKVNGVVVSDAGTVLDFPALQEAVCLSFTGPASFYPASCPKRKIQIKGPRPDVIPKIKMQVFWRALCPACQWTFKDVIPKILLHEEIRHIIDFQPVPAAGMTSTTSGLTCTGGIRECTDHRWLSCIVHEFQDPDVFVPMLKCFESKLSQSSNDWMQMCTTVGQSDKLRDCFETKSKELLEKHIKVANTMGVGWMPYIVLNGHVIGDTRTGLTATMIIDNICRAYQGDPKYLPSVCIGVDANGAGRVRGKPRVEDSAAWSPCNDRSGRKSKKQRIYNDPPDVGAQWKIDEMAAARKHITLDNSLEDPIDRSVGLLVLVMGGVFLSISGYLLYKVTRNLTRSTKSH